MADTWPPPLPTYTGDIGANVANSLGWLFETASIAGTILVQPLGTQRAPATPANSGSGLPNRDGILDKIDVPPARADYGVAWVVSATAVGALVAVFLMLRGK